MRGQMSLTPKTNQPAWISQNSSGAFSLYGCPVDMRHQPVAVLHISQATASVRVEYSGMGPCEKMAINAAAVHSGSHGHSGAQMFGTAEGAERHRQTLGGGTAF